ncbi:hypothetical protein FZEAL_2751 [Fusarium zealandicum]|uniref:Short chain dehydrogenase n=1 Tax=Fusarium zealandicum TaxID=1053134 RepID=A0A8H4UQ57_9HYPO|nr:hypothetical protein FZEAL_2751 [Fusarium zealandicum]
MSSAAPFDVAGKTAIITGAGSGINLAFAEILLSRNCNVVFADLSLREEAKALVAKYGDKGSSPRAVFAETDVTSWPALARMFEVALLEFGDFDIVCPGAGVYEPNWSNFWLPPGSDESKDDIDAGHYALLDINLTHPIRTTQLAISHWMHPRAPSNSEEFSTPAKVSAEAPKRVVHISSIAGQMPVFRAPMYGAAKFGITGFVRCLANLESAGIRVNAVAPGVVRTPLWTEHPEKLKYVDQSQDSWVTPHEVAQAMLSCVENDEHIGGTVLEVGKDNTRQVKVFDDPGPDLKDPKKGFTTSNSEEGNQSVWSWLSKISIWGAR